MIEKRELRLILLLFAVIVLLAALSVYLNLHKSEAQQVIRISVITDGAADEYWSRFRSGADQAALEYSADVRYLFPVGEDIAGQQLDYLKRETATADAVILFPADEARVSAWLAANTVSCPVFTVGTPLADSQKTVFIGADSAALGRLIAEDAAQNGLRQFYVYYSADMNSALRARFDAIKSTLTAKAIRLNTYDDPAQLSASLPDAVWRRCVLIGLDANTTLQAAQAASARPAAAVYGIGCTNALLALLESRGISSLAVQSEFDVGYLAVRSACAAGTPALPAQGLETYLITADSLNDPELSRVLIPIA